MAGGGEGSHAATRYATRACHASGGEPRPIAEGSWSAGTGGILTRRSATTSVRPPSTSSSGHSISNW